MPKTKSKRTLLEKVRGPNAIPVDTLVAQAEKALSTLNKEYLPFLVSVLPALEEAVSATQKSNAPDRWKVLAAYAHDLRSSSATAGYEQISAIAASLERALESADPGDPWICQVADSHLKSLKHLASIDTPALEPMSLDALLDLLGMATDQVAGR